jgi:hypothetical protein
VHTRADSLAIISSKPTNADVVSSQKAEWRNSVSTRPGSGVRMSKTEFNRGSRTEFNRGLRNEYNKTEVKEENNRDILERISELNATKVVTAAAMAPAPNFFAYDASKTNLLTEAFDINLNTQFYTKMGSHKLQGRPMSAVLRPKSAKFLDPEADRSMKTNILKNIIGARPISRKSRPVA